MSASNQVRDQGNAGGQRKLYVTVLLLAAAVFVGARLCWPGSQYIAVSDVQDQLKRILPNADSLLISRVSSTWGYTAVDAAQDYGEDGLGVLESFGDESAYCLKKDPPAFRALVQLWKLDPVRFRLATGPWNRAVLDWAQNRKLDAFLTKVDRLSRQQLDAADKIPVALPLLLSGSSPQVQEALDSYGQRAWQLFMAINFADSPVSVARVAEAISKYRDLSLDLNDEFGFPAALMLVAPETEKGSSRLPEVVQHACHSLGRPLAVTLLLVNYDDVARMLDSGTSAEAIYNAIDLLAGQPEFVQMLAVETPQILRLLCETWRGQSVGMEAFRRCGPAATIAYAFYGSDHRLSQAAVIALAGLGWPAFEVLDGYREHGPFYDLLRRPELMRTDDLNPLVVDAVGNVSRAGKHGQEKIDIYLHSRNLAGELMQDRYPPPESEKYLQWVPSYMAYRVGDKYLKGLDVSKYELLFAAVDVVLTLTPFRGAGKVATGAKALERGMEREAAAILARPGLSQAERAAALASLESVGREFMSQVEKTALSTIEREGIDLGARFGPDAGKIAMKRLEARGEGIALELADRSADYGAARHTGDLAKKNFIAEEIGLAGMEQYAKETGRTPLFIGKPRQGKGFDGVFEDGNHTVVMEAKGGGSQIKRFYDYYWQGTPEYTREVAKDVLARTSTSADEKSAAKKVLEAMEDGSLDIEVVCTEHVQGKPLPTRVKSAVSVGSKAGDAPLGDIKNLMLQTPGALLVFVRASAAESQKLAIGKFVNRSEKMATRAGVELWKPGAGPLMPRAVRRKGEEVIVKTVELPLDGEMSSVGEFAIAVMERSLP